MTAIRKPPFATRGHRAAAVALAVAGWWMVAVPLSAQELPHLTAKAEASRAMAAYEGTVEAVRQAVLAAQVPGAVLELTVKAGDRVRAGQTLVRIDARAAEQGAAASQAQDEHVLRADGNDQRQTQQQAGGDRGHGHDALCRLDRVN